MTTGNMPAKWRAEWLPSREAAAMDGADDENVGEAVHPHVSQLPKRVKSGENRGSTAVHHVWSLFVTNMNFQ